MWNKCVIGKMVVFFSILSVSDSLGFVPCYIDGTACGSSRTLALSSLPQLGDESTQMANEPAKAGVLPAHISIPVAGIDLPVQNPTTRDVEALDAYLTDGPARYVDSAKLGEEGNVIIFAHSSHLPVVHNKMYQAFNAIPDLKAGDSITLTGENGTSYLYRVDDVAKASVADGTTLDLSPAQGKKLTLVTCDTLTGKSARFILTATFVGTI